MKSSKSYLSPFKTPNSIEFDPCLLLRRIHSFWTVPQNLSNRVPSLSLILTYSLSKTNSSIYIHFHLPSVPKTTFRSFSYHIRSLLEATQYLFTNRQHESHSCSRRLTSGTKRMRSKERSTNRAFLLLHVRPSSRRLSSRIDCSKEYLGEVLWSLGWIRKRRRLGFDKKEEVVMGTGYKGSKRREHFKQCCDIL